MDSSDDQGIKGVEEISPIKKNKRGKVSIMKYSCRDYLLLQKANKKTMSAEETT